MKKFLKYINIILLSLLALGCVGEFIICFIRGYSELWSTILVGSILVLAFAVAAFLTKAKVLYLVSTVLLGVGTVLLIGFPSYYMYLGLVVTVITLILEIIWFVFRLMGKTKPVSE